MWGFPAMLQNIIDESRVPSVWMNARQDHDCVYPDEIQGFTLATQCLIDHGHRRIMYVGTGPDGADSRHYSVRDRIEAYSTAMQAAGLTPWISHPDQDVILLRELLPQMQEWLRRDDRPTAIILPGEAQYPTIHHAASVVGLRVPQDLSIIVCERMPVSSAGPDITTLLRDADAVGQKAVEMLQQKIANPSRKLAPMAVPYTLERPAASVAAAPSP
jgi:DNA-binding LacI/PurR family transcriptional regulator